MQPSSIDARPRDVREYLRILARRKWIIIASVAVTTLVAVLVATNQESTYVSSAEVRIIGDDSDSESLETEVRVMESEGVSSLAAEQLPSLPSLNAQRVVGTNIIRAEVTSTDPELAAQAANAYVQAYLRYTIEQARSRLLVEAEATQAQIDDLKPQIAALNTELDAQRAQIDERFPPTLPAPEGDAVRRQNEAERARLDERELPRLNSLNTQLFVLEGQLYSINADQEFSAAGAQVVSVAQVSDTPVSPDPLRNGLVGYVLGLLLGVGAALGFDHLDDRIKSRADIERSIGPQPPVLAVIPKVRSRAGKEIVDALSPDAVAEVYRSLRTSLNFMSIEDPFGVTLVTSANAGEGKTAVVGNLAAITARAGERVVLVDCDLRQPRLHELFELPNHVGLTSVMLGDVTVEEALQEVPRYRGLYVLTSGPVLPNPSELLSLARLRDMVGSLRANARVFLDSPAVLRVTDPVVLSSYADRSLVVVRADHTTRGDLRRALELLGRGTAPIAGLVLTSVHGREGDISPTYLPRSLKSSRSRHPARHRRPSPPTKNGSSRQDADPPAEVPASSKVSGLVRWAARR